MKAGTYCGYSLRDIIKIKQKEVKNYGKFFWGYGGVFCRPYIIKPFALQATKDRQKILVLFSETKSSFLPEKSQKSLSIFQTMFLLAVWVCFPSFINTLTDILDIVSIKLVGFINHPGKKVTIIQ